MTEKKTFAVIYSEGPESITQEAQIQQALAQAMKSVGVPFTIVPPDLVNPKLTKRAEAISSWVPDGKVVSFKDVPKFISRGNYATDYPMKDLVRWVEEEVSGYGLVLNPDFQRGHVWTEAQQVAYIEFLLRGGKTGRDLYFNHPSWHTQVPEGGYNEYVCVDGLQRLTAIQRFVKDELRIFGNLYSEFRGRPGMDQDYMRVHINDLKTKEEVLRWYLEMNAGGTPHSNEELGRVAAMLQELEKGAKNV